MPTAHSRKDTTPAFKLTTLLLGLLSALQANIFVYVSQGSCSTFWWPRTPAPQLTVQVPHFISPFQRASPHSLPALETASRGNEFSFKGAYFNSFVSQAHNRHLASSLSPTPYIQVSVSIKVVACTIMCFHTRTQTRQK